MHDPDEPEIIGEAHWSVFLPAAALVVAGFGTWAGLDLMGRGSGQTARATFVFAVVVAPVAVLLAFLRYQTTRVVRTFDGFWIETGWPSMTPQHVGFREVETVDVHPLRLTGALGAGNLDVRLTSGDRIRVTSVAAARSVADAISSARFQIAAG